MGLAGSSMKELPENIADQRLIVWNGMLPRSGIILPKPFNSICVSLSDLGVKIEWKPCILVGDWAMLRKVLCSSIWGIM